MYDVNLTYFRSNGKYYSTGAYVTFKDEMFEVFAEVRQMAEDGTLPGVNPGVWYILVEVPKHEHNHPFLIIPAPLYLGEDHVRNLRRR